MSERLSGGDWKPNPPCPSWLHEWESGTGWGVIIGVSKCKRCGRVSRASDFAASASREQEPDR